MVSNDGPNEEERYTFLKPVSYGEEKKVLDHGFIVLDTFAADDLSVVNAARVSLHKHSETMEEKDAGLIRYLISNRHGTPFEHNFFRFRIKAPIFVFREWHRHRIGHSYNEWSARYSELKEEFYIPENVVTQVGKPGAYTFEPANSDIKNLFIMALESNCKAAFNRYKFSVENGIAKQQARLFLPVNIYSEMYWSCNARSLMHFLNLRNSEQAQWEIRQYAIVIEEIFSKIMPVTHRCFLENGREAP